MVKKDTGKHLSYKVQPMAESDQMSLFAVATDPVLEELGNKLEAIDPNKLSPMQALLLIDEWKKVTRPINSQANKLYQPNVGSRSVSKT